MVDNIIDFSIHVPKEYDADCHYTDDDGFEWFKYAGTFTHKDKTFGIDVWANSIEGAENILKSIGNGKIEGQVLSQFED